MARIRHFERTIAELWREGRICGEMHLGIGEEAIAAGVVAHLREGDGLAVDHRSTPPLVARGVDLEAMLLEMLGSEDGLCRARGGHMHLFSAEHLAASSGIVGAGGPMACGFALAAQRLRPGAVGVGFFGDGAMNQGMLLEALNLAQAWRLPVLFVCKDNRWAISPHAHARSGCRPSASTGSTQSAGAISAGGQLGFSNALFNERYRPAPRTSLRYRIHVSVDGLFG
jgi:pyruvate dehydrogenase E1 component alpha subunit